jgi:hypothetical protein
MLLKKKILTVKKLNLFSPKGLPTDDGYVLANKGGNNLLYYIVNLVCNTPVDPVSF